MVRTIPARKLPYQLEISRSLRADCSTIARVTSDIRTHFTKRREMRSSLKGCWQGAQRGQRPFREEPEGSGLFGRIAALRLGVKTPSLDPESRLALHPKQGKLALTPLCEMSSTASARCRSP